VRLIQSQRIVTATVKYGMATNWMYFFPLVRNLLYLELRVLNQQ
jgi:hypothetical protein